MNTSGESIRVMHPLFQEGQGGSIPTSPLQLHFAKCTVCEAMALNKLWHSRLPLVIESNITRTALNVCYAASFDGKFYAVAIWTSPTAFTFGPMCREWLELRRLAIANDAPKNTASRMLGWMVRDVRKRFPEVTRLISYQDTEVHTGGIYKAAGWEPTVKSFDRRNRGLRSGRKRNMSQTTAVKQRWEKIIRNPVESPEVME